MPTINNTNNPSSHLPLHSLTNSEGLSGLNEHLSAMSDRNRTPLLRPGITKGGIIEGEAAEDEAVVSGSLDALIADTLHRQELVKDLDRLIITDVRHRALRTWLHRWVRIIAFSFGLPLVLMLWVVYAYLYIKEHGTTSFTLSLMVWPTLALTASTAYVLKTFSASKV